MICYVSFPTGFLCRTTAAIVERYSYYINPDLRYAAHFESFSKAEQAAKDYGLRLARSKIYTILSPAGCNPSFSELPVQVLDQMQTMHPSEEYETLKEDQNV